jgi:cobalamin biosynthetic protein CobC
MNEPPAADPKPLAHGGRLIEARRMFPGAPEPFLDLSTGINPVPYPLPTFGTDCFTRLPEPEAETALLSAATAARCRTRHADPDRPAASPLAG